MQPLPASAIGSFRERPVSPKLREFFSARWLHEMPQAPVPPIIVAPDGTIDLQWIDGVLRVAGPDKEPIAETVPAGATVIGFRFRPAAAAAWLRVSARELVGERPLLEEIWGPGAKRLANQVWKTQKGSDLVTAIEDALAENAPDARADVAMNAAYALVEAGPPPGVPLAPWLGRVLGMSERTLRRRFDESYGYGPKTLERILRYQRFMRLSRTSSSSMAVLAAEAGYSDQAHLVRESRRLTGETPKRHRRAETKQL